MSCQPPHWTRRNVSPGSHHRPVRATVPVSLMRQNQDSPTKTNLNKNDPPLYPTAKDSNDEQLCCQDLFSAVEKPTIFLGPRGEKSKTLNLRSQPQQHYLRRTNSLDAIYLATPCQSETIILGYYKKFMIDKATQTTEGSEMEWRKVQWKPISAAGEQLEVKYIRQKLQRTNQNSRVSSGLFCSQRQSPIQGDHSAISVSASGVYHQTSPTSLGLLHKSVHLPSAHTSGPIPIQPSKPVVPRLQNSVEGLNQEIEKLVLKEWSRVDKGEYKHVFEPPPEGHRAPVPELFHSSQSSPCLVGQDSHASSGTTSRSHSISPVVPIIPGIPEFSISPHSDESEGMHKLGTSPLINQFLAREPPDGCEKIKIRDEPRRHPHFDLFSSDSDLTKPQVTFVLLPSQSSAFCPLYKEIKTPPNGHFESFTMVSSTQTNCHN